MKSGYKGKVLNLLRDMYSKIKCRIKMSNWFYDWIKDDHGTNQGGSLSDNMFRELLCNMRSFLNTEYGIVINGENILFHILWVDKLLRMSSSEIGLTKQLNRLLKFVSKYQLIVNILKTRVLILEAAISPSLRQIKSIILFRGPQMAK